MKPNAGALVHFDAAQKRRQLFLDACEAGATIVGACQAANVSDAAYRQWRRKYPQFAGRVDAVRATVKSQTKGAHIERGTAMGFAQFRLECFGHESPPFHLEVINAMESLQKGQILLVLFAPLHGKTTLYEDYTGMKFAFDRDWMTTVGMNKVDHSKKVLGRVKARMEPDSGYATYLARYGPWRLVGPGSNKQIWAATHFNVTNKAQGSDRDYSMQAIGASSSTASIRTKHLHGDDLQDKNTEGQTDQIEDRVRQDWLSRPADEGITTIFGNRVNDDDVYNRLLEDEQLRTPRPDGRGSLLRVIQIPAIRKNDKGEDEPLWPGRWTLDSLDDMRMKVGEVAWARNWLQRPDLVRKNRHFVAEDIMGCYNPGRKLEPMPGGICWIGLDPAIGGKNCVLAADVSAGIRVTGIREAEGLESNEQIMEQLEAEVVHQQLHGAIVPRVIIESKNFQAGLARDERLLKMADHYHFEIYEHLTGINKWDSDIGVLSMLYTMKSKEFDFPWHPDDPSGREEIQILTNQFYAFRTSADEMIGNRKFRGNVLRQDRVMALWFIWIHWRLNTKVPVTNAGGWQTQMAGDLRITPTQPQLIIPVGARI